MGHNLNYNQEKGTHAFFSVKQQAWHGLGQIVQDYPTSAEALKFAGLDYLVEKRPLFTFDSDNHHANPDSELIIPEIKVPDFFATLRTDTDQVLGVVTKDYQVVQNTDAFAFFDSLVGGDSGIMYETAGALGQGEKIFITAKLPGYIRVGKDDVTEKYIFLTTSHDGTGSITAAFTPVRIVCQNTLNAAMRDMTRVVRIRHTASAKDRLMNARFVMGITDKVSEELEEIFNHWKNVRITDKEVKQLIQLAMCPNKETLEYLKKGQDEELSARFVNTCDKAFEYAMSSESQLMETTEGTVFGAYNAVTGYFQNVREYKNDEAKMKSILYGGSAQTMTQKAFDLCDKFQHNGRSALILN